MATKGVALKHHPRLAALGLRAGMRVEPQELLQNVGGFFTLEFFPCPITLWDTGLQTATKHRNPLVRASLGVSFATFCVDVLHCLHLGCFNVFCTVVMWLLLDSQCWARAANFDVAWANSLVVLKARLTAFYKRHPRLTRTGDFTKGMCGDPGDRKCKLKGAETWGFMLFLLEELRRFPHIANQRRLLGAGEALEQLIGIWRAGSWKLTAAEVQRSFDCWSRYISFTSGDIGYLFEYPKRHLTMHMLRSLSFLGNPYF